MIQINSTHTANARPGQLIKWACHWVSEWVSETFNFNVELSKTHVTFLTIEQKEEWGDMALVWPTRQRQRQSDSQRVTWTALGILAMFSLKPRSKIYLTGRFVYKWTSVEFVSYAFALYSALLSRHCWHFLSGRCLFVFFPPWMFHSLLSLEGLDTDSTSFWRSGEKALRDRGDRVGATKPKTQEHLAI